MQCCPRRELSKCSRRPEPSSWNRRARRARHGHLGRARHGVRTRNADTGLTHELRAMTRAARQLAGSPAPAPRRPTPTIGTATQVGASKETQEGRKSLPFAVSWPPTTRQQRGACGFEHAADKRAMAPGTPRAAARVWPAPAHAVFCFWATRAMEPHTPRTAAVQGTSSTRAKQTAPSPAIIPTQHARAYARARTGDEALM